MAPLLRTPSAGRVLASLVLFMTVVVGGCTGDDQQGDREGEAPAADGRYYVERGRQYTVVTTQFEALPAPELTLVSRGEHDALQLEWTGGPTNVTTWQYRQRSWQDGQPLEWGDWTDIPSSGAATRGYRLTGLTEFTGYSVEMRGVVGPLTGPASNTVNASTHHRTNHPEMYPGRVVEGDGQTEWRLHRLGVLITIPAGKRLTVGQGSIAHGWIGTGDDRWPTRAQIDLYDEVTGSVLVLD